METVNVVEAKKNFSDLMAQVAYRDQRIVIERHGKPMMAWVSIADLARLEAIEVGADAMRRRRELALAQAAAVRTMIREERQGYPLPDSADVLTELRERRIDDLASVR